MPPPKATPLTHKQRGFVEAYVELRNGAAAARKAGYSDATAKEIACQLLKRTDVRKAIREHEELDERLRGEERRYVLNSLREVAERARQAEPVRDPKGKKLGVYRFDGATAVRALELLGKNEGLFREQIDVRVQGAVEELLTGIRPLMSPAAYVELLAALAEVTGIDRVAPEADAGSGPAPVH